MVKKRLMEIVSTWSNSLRYLSIFRVLGGGWQLLLASWGHECHRRVHQSRPTDRRLCCDSLSLPCECRENHGKTWKELDPDVHGSASFQIHFLKSSKNRTLSDNVFMIKYFIFNHYVLSNLVQSSKHSWLISSCICLDQPGICMQCFWQFFLYTASHQDIYLFRSTSDEIQTLNTVLSNLQPVVCF